jgi:L-malate glycosyltransferase
MNLLLTVDHQFKRTPDGKVWVKTIYGYDFWTRYLQSFNSVRVVGRIEDVENVDSDMLLSSGNQVEFYALPQYRGFSEYVKRYFQIYKSAKGAVEGCDCAIFRIPSPIAGIIYKKATKQHLPIVVEVVNDPWDTFAPGSFKSLVRPLVRLLLTYQVKNMTKHANGASYVTEKALQKRYPSRAKIKGESVLAFESYYSSITLKDEYFSEPKLYDFKISGLTLVHTNSCITDYSKGHDIVIHTVKMLREKNIDVNVIFIGDGPMRKDFEEYALNVGVSNHVNFTGLLSGSKAVREVLKKGDIFIFPTYGEGLPRSVIEAMAVGLPCLSTPVNGIPELLECECLLPLDSVAYANKICEWYNNPKLMNNISARNIEKAREYRVDILNARRKKFYNKLASIAEKLR